MGVYYAKAMHAAMVMLLGGSVRTFDNDLMRQVHAWTGAIAQCLATMLLVHMFCST